MAHSTELVRQNSSELSLPTFGKNEWVEYLSVICSSDAGKHYSRDESYRLPPKAFRNRVRLFGTPVWASSFPWNSSEMYPR